MSVTRFSEKREESGCEALVSGNGLSNLLMSGQYAIREG